ncbi:RHS repeat-associated core domain-containing protein [Streptomyces sp. NPDC006284]|uniref:RHS repeat-associated core domain-containing protein n=1 Tax=unclassified Streptomyces TaxID=2593676 RepID=UPI0033A9B363
MLSGGSATERRPFVHAPQASSGDGAARWCSPCRAAELPAARINERVNTGSVSATRQVHAHLRARPHRPAPRHHHRSSPQPYRYAGAYADPTGLYKMGHRYYDPALGRFTQPDPSGQEENPYLYAAGNPINNSDPQGLLSLGGVLEGVSIGLTLGALVDSGPLGIGLGVAAAGADIASAAVSDASGSEIAGVAVVNAFTLGVGGGASALAKGSAAAGRAAISVDAGYAALGYRANKLITS